MIQPFVVGKPVSLLEIHTALGSQYIALLISKSNQCINPLTFVECTQKA
jgi:hypothetical protein